MDLMTKFELRRALMDVIQSPSLRHELDRYLGDFCHQCRNRLNSLKLSIYLAKRQSNHRLNGAWKILESEYQALENQIDRIHTICRPPALTRVLLDLDLLIDDRRASWASLLDRSGSLVEFRRGGGDATVSYDVNQLGAALDALVTWRAEQGGRQTSVVIHWWVDTQDAHISWQEICPAEPELSAGHRSESSSWNLPLLIRVVAAHGGRVEVNETCGWRVLISWPRL